MLDGEETMISEQKLEANRRNAQRSTGPRTEEGKRCTRYNAVKHGILTQSALVGVGPEAGHEEEFRQLVGDLVEDQEPVGALEIILVEKIAVLIWRQRRALRCEVGYAARAQVATFPQALDMLGGPMEFGAYHDLGNLTDHLSLPLGDNLDRILRYEASIQRQLSQTLNQLERLQSARRGQQVLATTA